ncbi:UNVERIFIED_CONTAM: Prefoldin subunit [Sesamum calycinum]|uniref:Prefoldin subunit n=1 Tax=Sesamum calycinum TaxID=2727403 RepID=A0AAW2Q736_9LAMI
MAAVKELQRDLENKANDLNKLQKDIAKNHQVRKKYTIQLGENELVLKELDLLNEEANVYKLIGPVLVKQDLAEANANVRKRIDYISAELKRLDATLQDLEEKQNSKKEAVDFQATTKNSGSAGWKRQGIICWSPEAYGASLLIGLA